MSIIAETTKLIDGLTDGLATARSGTDGVHLVTTRAPWRDEPGDVDLLAVTSTNRYVLGHTWFPVDGHIDPMVWPRSSAGDALALMKSWSKGKGKDHTTHIDITLADPPENAKDDEHPGWTVTLSEAPALFDSDNKFEFHAHHGDRFPISIVHRIYTGQFVTKEDYVEVPMTSWSATVLAPLVEIAKRRNMNIKMFRSPERLVQLVQIGDTWIGMAVPATPLPGEPTDGPDIEPVLAPDDGLLAALREMKDNGIEVSVDGANGPVGQAIADAVDQLAIDDDNLLRQAVELVVSTQFVSAANLQRKLKVGFGKAQWILGELTAAGIVTAAEGSSARNALFGPAQVADALKALGNVSEQ
ncbi:DNA translocase FtsK [Mycobacteroides abscessus subsp. bolletii]|uniref:DNA translocase FtsK n=1 Tax=Mycobacteroides abscessus TaxID=36809 RepID=UPI0009A81873|nr:DNA translocase FtsK [Mycobacteroides abscessus]SLF46963.1 DNA translocase FtsK [Mycobacteroides abscessus subsp. bolletii]